MEELIYRFEIVRLATKISDQETIAIQAKKIAEVSINDELNEIVSLLESKKYRPALFAMKAYLEDADSSFLDMPTISTLHKDEPKIKKLVQTSEIKETKKIDILSNQKKSKENITNTLFDMDTHIETEEKVISLDEMLRLTEESSEETIKEDNTFKGVNKYIEQTKEEIAKENIDLDADKEVQVVTDIEDIDIDKDDKDDNPDQHSIVKDFEVDTLQLDEEVESIDEKVVDENVNIFNYDMPEPEIKDIDSQLDTPDDIEINADDIDNADNQVNDDDESSFKAKNYSPISYIEQKYKNMLYQFPQVEKREEGLMLEVIEYLRQFSTYGYSDNDINDILSRYKTFKERGDKAEAAQLILLAAATEASIAQLLLARELYKGNVLKKDLPEAFTQINRLAEHNYPEAICDLAQLYEYGHGIKKDKKTALLLYEEALEMGVERARKHVEKLRNSKSLFGGLLKI